LGKREEKDTGKKEGVKTQGEGANSPIGTEKEGERKRSQATKGLHHLESRMAVRRGIK